MLTATGGEYHGAESAATVRAAITEAEVDRLARDYLNGAADHLVGPVVIKVRDHFALGTADAVRVISRANALRGGRRHG